MDPKLDAVLTAIRALAPGEVRQRVSRQHERSEAIVGRKVTRIRLDFGRGWFQSEGAREDKMLSPLVSVVIPTHNRPASVRP
jgi:hypothetical protein